MLDFNVYIQGVGMYLFIGAFILLKQQIEKYSGKTRSDKSAFIYSVQQCAAHLDENISLIREEKQHMLNVF